jgi:hypothetical protein
MMCGASRQSTAEVWAVVQGSAALLLGVLWVLESLAARAGAVAARDQLRTGLLLASLFGVSWLVAGNVW